MSTWLEQRGRAIPVVSMPRAMRYATPSRTRGRPWQSCSERRRTGSCSRAVAPRPPTPPSSPPAGPAGIAHDLRRRGALLRPRGRPARGRDPRARSGPEGPDRSRPSQASAGRRPGCPPSSRRRYGRRRRFATDRRPAGAGELPVVQPRGRDAAAGGRGRGVLPVGGRARCISTPPPRRVTSPSSSTRWVPTSSPSALTSSAVPPASGRSSSAGASPRAVHRRWCTGTGPTGRAREPDRDSRFRRGGGGSHRARTPDSRAGCGPSAHRCSPRGGNVGERRHRPR